jgi:hypothetical protein
MAKPRQEKRDSKRVKVKSKVPVRFPESSTPIEAVTRDISLRGVYLCMESRVMYGSELEVVLPLPATSDNDPSVWVRCKCRVIRVEELPDSSEYGVAATIETFETVQEAIVPEEVPREKNPKK